ncbi:cytochrome c oxidase subunit 3 [Flavihumibacter solisilvae]|uniref:Nitric oxide reductase n=1 Tax=Flavihumibacter solisilvae TaxID=1349421 RepID=A0A0C1L2M7_9BACT|nr:cytochrome c oxidase subunit 3 [Flavihumibacter solisilvae]KIC94252.1 nitric oxide reductase [Flavihumibacter solisilvae]
MKELNTNPDLNNFWYPPGGILVWMLIFLELATFGMGIIALIYCSKEDPALFHTSRLSLNKTFGAINTALLLTSGYFMASTINELRRNNRAKASFYLQLTMLGGLLFMVLKGVEYSQKLNAGISINTNLFYTFYWMLTAFHGVHVAVGLVMLAVSWLRLRKKDAVIDMEHMEAGAAFWHMCDLIWLLLFPALYLVL